MGINLKNPIFAVYINVSGMSRSNAANIISNYAKYFESFDNITAWIIPVEKDILEEDVTK